MKEFSIKKDFNRYELEITGEYDCGDFVTSSYVTYVDTSHGKGCEKIYSASLALLADFGTLNGEGDDTKKVAPYIIEKMIEFADANGY
jgi:hypothetical protein